MTSISNFESNVYSEELHAASESEYDDVMQAMADDDFAGYCEWSAELEQGQIVKTAHGPILINRDCSHSDCPTTRCKRDVRMGGIAI